MNETPSLIRTLWLDDKISGYGRYVDSMREQGFSIRKCRTNQEAMDAIKATTYDLIIVDLKLQNETGVEFIQEMVKLGVRSTIVVLSSFLYEKNFVYLLRDISANLFLVEKNLPASDSPAFREFATKLKDFSQQGAKKSAEEFFNGATAITEKDPFSITYLEYVALPPSVQDAIYLSAYERVESIVHKEARRGAKWMIFCGNPDAPEDAVDDLADRWGDEDIEDLAVQNNRIPFVFESPDDPDDVGCGGTSEEAASYPTINLLAFGVADQSAGAREVRRGAERYIFKVHFDTGSYHSYFSLEQWIFHTGDPHPGRRSIKEYRGKPEIMYEKTVSVRVQDQMSPRVTKAVEIPMFLVKNFDGSNLTARCPVTCTANGRSPIGDGIFNCVRRVGLIGRNLVTENQGLSISLTGNPMSTRL